ncbi:hypothetical protein CCACVL1_13638 [Corchorus capsularis]|uniref:Uncharacterized protein n=1 Tax=Corchorus capsularis TaxID=210143 RepID=A0A1R3IA70_COCAP|nr:hypothetical protein CCACVL1_13638 [Corchorus capsularis]
MAQKVVLKIMTMNDEKTKKKAIEAVADIYDIKNQIPKAVAKVL